MSAFYDVLLAQEHAKLAAGSTDLARRAADAAAKRVQAGKISPVEETKARVAEATARLEAAQAASELRLSRQRLAATWGDAVPRFDTVESDGALPPTPTFDAVAARLAASPSLRRAQIEVQRRSALSDLERATRTPDLTVSLGLKRDEQLGRNQAVIGLSIQLPLFDRKQGNLLEALRREDKSRDELAAADIQLKSAMAQAWGRLDTAGVEARTIREQVMPGAQPTTLRRRVSSWASSTSSTCSTRSARCSRRKPSTCAPAARRTALPPTSTDCWARVKTPSRADPTRSRSNP